MIKALLNHRSVRSLIIVVSGILVTAIFFRTQLFTHSQRLFGDFYDGLIAFSIIHHWYNVFHGIEPWRNVSYFSPYVGTLGYNDGYFLYGVIYSALRGITANIFTTFELTNAIIRLIGFYSFFYLCNKQLNLKFWVCLLTASIFTLSNSVYMQSVHAQIFSISFAPLLTIFLINYFRQLFIDQNALKAILWGSIAGIFYSAWLLSAYYMAWFYALFACFWVGCALVLQFRYKQFSFEKPSYIAIFIPIIITLLSLIPFLMTYLPTAKQTGMHLYDEARYYTPRILDLFNLGNQNLLWGKLVSYLDLRNDEFSVGFPLVFLTLLIVALRATIKEKVFFYRPLAYAIMISILISLMIFKLSLWYLIWHWFPGAKGLRTVCRFWIFLVFPMCVLLTYYLSKKTVWHASVFSVLIPFLLILEQINVAPMTNLSEKGEQAFIDAAKNIPGKCHAFFVIGTRHKETPSMGKIINNVDAMFISEIVKVRTINGTSTFVPPDWNFDYFPKETYLNRIKTYASKHHIQNLCLFDINTMKWRASF